MTASSNSLGFCLVQRQLLETRKSSSWKEQDFLETITLLLHSLVPECIPYCSCTECLHIAIDSDVMYTTQLLYLGKANSLQIKRPSRVLKKKQKYEHNEHNTLHMYSYIVCTDTIYLVVKTVGQLY